ncbi:hypothetical protein FB107DRAFT_289902 [Schizophyllum commune]
MDFSWVKDKSTSFFSFIHGSKYDELRALPTTEQIRAARQPARPAAKQSPPRRSTISSAPDPPVHDTILVGANHLPQRTESPGRFIRVYSADRVKYVNSDGVKDEKFPNLQVVMETTIRTSDSPIWYESCEVPKGTDKVIAFTAWNISAKRDMRIADSEYYTVKELLDISLGASVAISLEVDGKGKHRSTSLFFIAEDISPRPRTPQPPSAPAVGPSSVGSSGAGSSGGPSRRVSV